MEDGGIMTLPTSLLAAGFFNRVKPALIDDFERVGGLYAFSLPVKFLHHYNYSYIWLSSTKNISKAFGCFLR